MTATQLSLVTRRRYFFPQIQAGTAQELVLPDLRRTVSFSSGTLLLRLYSINMPSASSAFILQLNAVMHGPDDPRTLLTGPQLAQISLPPTVSSSPELIVASIAGAPPALIRALLRFQAGAAAGACDITLAADLVLREHT